MENETETLDSQNETETTETNNEVVDIGEQEGVDELKQQIATLKAQKEHWKIKALKTEVKAEEKTSKEPEPSQELSAKDSLLLAKADIDVEDVDEVLDFARFRKIPVAEALKNNTLKAILADKKEERRTSQATLTKSSRANTPSSPEALIEKARKGEIKEDDIDKLVQARMEGKLKSKS